MARRRLARAVGAFYAPKVGLGGFAAHALIAADLTLAAYLLEVAAEFLAPDLAAPGGAATRSSTRG